MQFSPKEFMAAYTKMVGEVNHQERFNESGRYPILCIQHMEVMLSQMESKKRNEQLEAEEKARLAVVNSYMEAY